MGRGRAKAKQTKVARQLKYGSGGTDLARLEAELAADRGPAGGQFVDPEPEEEEDLDLDGYASADYDDEPDRATGR